MKKSQITEHMILLIPIKRQLKHCIESMRVSHCILDSTEGDIWPMQDLKIQIVLGWYGYFPQILQSNKAL